MDAYFLDDEMFQEAMAELEAIEAAEMQGPPVPLSFEEAKARLVLDAPAPTLDPVAHPPHYTNHPSGIECIEVTRHMGFNLGNALKYIWRCDLKRDAIEDLRKAIWYLQDEIDMRLGGLK